MRKSNGRVYDLSIPNGRAIVTFETPYAGNRAELNPKGTGVKGKHLPSRSGPSRVEFHAFEGQHAVYLGMAHASEAKRVNRDVLETEMQLESPEPDGRQYAVSKGGMRVRVR